MIAIAYTLSFCFLGAQMIRWLMPRKSPLVRAWLGVSLGVLMEMGLPALCANALDFTVAAHIAAVAAALLLAALCYAAREKAPLCRMSAADRRQMAVMAAVGIPLTALSAYLQYTHNIMPAADGSLWCGQATYGDLCMHLSFVTSLKNMRFPPSYSLLAGTSLAYPYLTDALSTTFYMLGMPLNLSLVVPGTLLMALTYAGYMLLAQQILGGRHKAVAVAALLFFFNGGLGFLYDFDLAFADHFARVKEIFTGYYKTPANQPDLNLRFSNVIADLMLPQRALLGGWAMGIPALYLLISSVREKSYRQTALLALWAAALPLVHTHTFLALALFSGGYLLGNLIEHRAERCGVLLRAGLYLAVVLALALPQLVGNAVRQTLEGGALRFQFNWVNNSGGRGLKDGYLRPKAGESGYRAGHDGDLRRRRDDPLSAERIRQQQAVLYLVHVRHDPRGGLRLDAHAAAGRSAGARAALRAVSVGERVFRRAVAGARGGFRLSALFRQRGRGGRLDSGKHRPRRRISDRAAAHQPRLLAGGAADYLRQRFVRLLPRAGLFAAIGGLQALL